MSGGQQQEFSAEELAQRFGGGRIAREAAARVLQQRVHKPGMFEQQPRYALYSEQQSVDLLDEEAYSSQPRCQHPAEAGSTSSARSSISFKGSQLPDSRHVPNSGQQQHSGGRTVAAAYNPDLYPYRAPASVTASLQGHDARSNTPSSEHGRDHSDRSSNNPSPRSDDLSGSPRGHTTLVTTTAGFHALLPAQRPGLPLSRSASPYSSVESLPHSPRSHDSDTWPETRQHLWDDNSQHTHQAQLQHGPASPVVSSRPAATPQQPPPARASLDSRKSQAQRPAQSAVAKPSVRPASSEAHGTKLPHGPRRISTVRVPAPPPARQPASTAPAAAQPMSPATSPVTPAANPQAPASAFRPKSAPAKGAMPPSPATQHPSPKAFSKGGNPLAATGAGQSKPARPLSAAAGSKHVAAGPVAAVAVPTKRVATASAISAPPGKNAATASAAAPALRPKSGAPIASMHAARPGSPRSAHPPHQQPSSPKPALKPTGGEPSAATQVAQRSQAGSDPLPQVAVQAAQGITASHVPQLQVAAATSTGSAQAAATTAAPAPPAAAATMHQVPVGQPQLTAPAVQAAPPAGASAPDPTEALRLVPQATLQHVTAPSAAASTTTQPQPPPGTSSAPLPPVPQQDPQQQQPATPSATMQPPSGNGTTSGSLPAAPSKEQAKQATGAADAAAVMPAGPQPVAAPVAQPAAGHVERSTAALQQASTRQSSLDEAEELAEFLNDPAPKKVLLLPAETTPPHRPGPAAAASKAPPAPQHSVPAQSPGLHTAPSPQATSQQDATVAVAPDRAAARHDPASSSNSSGPRGNQQAADIHGSGAGVPHLPRSESPGPFAHSQRPPAPRRPASAGAAGSRVPGGFVASSGDRTRDSHEASEQYYERFRVKKHRDPTLFHYPGRRPTPDYRFSQPALHGPQVTLQQVVWSFDDAHPALAGTHCMRTKEQDTLLVEERRRQRKAALHEAAAHAKHQQHQKIQNTMARSHGRSCDNLGSKYEERLADLHEVGRMYRSQEVSVEQRSAEQRAKQALAASAALSARHRNRSRSPSPSVRSPSPLRPASAGAFPLPRMMLPHPDDRYVKELELRVNQLQRKIEFMAQGEDAAGVDEDVAHAVDALHGGLYTNVNEDASRTLADHLAVLNHRENLLLEEEELIKASGAYHPGRFEEYAEHLRQKRDIRTQKGRERGAVELGYDSDIEEEEAQRAAQEADEALADLEHVSNQKQLQLTEQWEDDNAWMDEYRDPSRRSTATPSRQHAPASRSQSDHEDYGQEEDWDEDEEQQEPGGHRSACSSQQWAARSVPVGLLSEDEEWLLQQPYVPALSSELQHLACASDHEEHAGNVGRGHSPGYHSEGYPARHVNRRRRHKFTPTVPTPFAFEERSKQRPKPIAQVKLEQDLELKRQEAEAAKKKHFHANPVPSSTLQPRYQNILAEQEYKRMLSHERNAENLRVQEQPFSFYNRDINKQTARKEFARDPNRFQIKFKAKPIPAHVNESRFMMMMAEAEAQKVAAHARLDAARAKSRLLREQQAEQRRHEADEAYQRRLHETKVRRVDPVWNQKYDTKPLGTVPDFNLLHIEWERQQAAIKAANRSRVTVPQEFSIHGGTPEEAERRARKQAERRQRMLMEMALDEQHLTETRWPYKSRRAKVRPTPPPAFEQPDTSHADTKANRLRIAATRQAILQGQYATKETKEQQALEHAKRVAAERARTWTKMQQRLAAGKLGTNMGDLQAYGSPGTDGGRVDDTTAGTDGAGGGKREGTLERREKLRGRSDAPVQHIEARHRQAEMLARQEVEAVLLAQGLDVYKYVEG